MKYFTIYFDSSESPDLIETNKSILNPERFRAAERKLVFEMVHTTLARKFLTRVHDCLARNRGTGGSREILYNYYIKRDMGHVLNAKRDLNLTIEKINAIGEVSIPDSLRIDECGHALESEKLNKLHLVFETMKKQDFSSEKQVTRLLWRINNLLHLLEAAASMTREALVPNCLIVGFIPAAYDVLLEPEDYGTFELPRENDLYLDYGTIGKDLLDCFFTNDLELVRGGGVSQQRHLQPGFRVDLGNKSESSKSMRKRYDAWLRENRISEHLDLRDPIYAPGRALLGKLVEPDLTGKDWREFFDRDYAMAGFAVSN